MKVDKPTREALQNIVELLIKNSVLLAFNEKREFLQLTPILDIEELLELFQLLAGSKAKMDEMLTKLEQDNPEFAKELMQYQKDTVNTVYKEQRKVLKQAFL